MNSTHSEAVERDPLAEGALELDFAANPIVTSTEFARRVRGRSGLHPVVGVEGCGAPLLAFELAGTGAEHVLVVCADADTARRAAADLSTLGAGLLPRRPSVPNASHPLLLLPAESTPYTEVHPDRRAAMTRASALFHIAVGLPWRFLVTTATALARRVAPPALVVGAGIQLVREAELDVREVAERLVASGYLRVPLVEDPGSFAVRGGVLDVWASGSGRPLRVELYGDLIATLRTFDPDDQRTSGEIEHAWLPPAREAILTPATIERARDRVRALADAVNLPSTKTRQLVEDIVTGKAVFGAEAFLPAYADLVPLVDYLDAQTPIVIEGGAGVLEAIRSELGQASVELARRADVPSFPLPALYLDEPRLAHELQSRCVVVTHRTGVVASANSSLEDPTDELGLAALELVAADTPSLGQRDHADLTRAVQAARAEHGKQGALDPLVRRLAAWREAGLEVIVTARAATQAQRLAALLTHRSISVEHEGGHEAGDADDEARPHLDAELDEDRPMRSTEVRQAVRIICGPLARGAIVRAEGFVLVTEEEVFGQRAHRRTAARRSPRAVLEDLRALGIGDYVVHVDHGIGRYVALEKRVVGKVTLELVVIEYLGGDKLFLPVYRLNQIQKYSGSESSPKLDRLGGLSFAKTKAKVQRRVRQMADELLRLYAERTAVKKVPLEPGDDEYATFEATFPFEETRDQAAAIGDVMRDLESERVMDRLVCGDVGFGKTEVALRAAFRNAIAGRQVALLCPTTVLAQQHYLSFSSRLSGYPIVVRSLSRFESKTEQQATLKGLKAGSVDIVIGTHRLLSKDVHFKRLGLLVVDEEQRFGVSHKERIKQLRASVDALTLSATPIPRTLQMAVGGMRDMSLITTPPVDRRAIRTITARFDEQLIREAVTRELTRGGQIFYVFNRIEGLYERAARLQQLVPEARIAVAHGQMNETALERTMIDFVGGAYDILVSTAIIESGIDIPRANTILIDRADLFGLAQLYQLRGRVGRAAERAYCYLLVPPPTEMSEDARSRLEVLEKHTELGAGFTIATLDLELRGAGELLGAEQSGFAATVGFDLFCQMLEEATQQLRGATVVAEVEPELSFDVEALLPEDYVDDVGVRLSLYKRLASASDEAEVAEIGAEMEDRFGEAPIVAQRLVEMMRLKTELRRLRVLGVEASAKSVTLHLREDTPLDAAAVGSLLGRRGSRYKLSADARLTRRIDAEEGISDGLAAADLALSELAACTPQGG